MDITTKSVCELKALAYDLLAQMEAVQANLRIINTEIAKRSEAPKEIEPLPDEIIE